MVASGISLQGTIVRLIVAPPHLPILRRYFLLFIEHLLALLQRLLQEIERGQAGIGFAWFVPPHRRVFVQLLLKRLRQLALQMLGLPSGAVGPWIHVGQLSFVHRLLGQFLLLQLTSFRRLLLFRRPFY